MKNKKRWMDLLMFVLILACLNLFYLHIVSASGLRITNQSTSSITKILGQSTSFTIDLVNDKNFSFYNVSMLSNSYLSFITIPEIAPGQILRINISLTSDSNFDSIFEIYGGYIINMGSSNNSYNVSVDFYNGIDNCDFSVIKGDSVVFYNQVTDSIVMRNSVTQNDIVTILQGQNYNMLMDYPQTLSYYFLRRGYIFTPVCTITVLDTQGLVNNPQYNAKFTLSGNVIFTPTTVTWVTPLTNYTINVFQTQEGIMSITNTGNTTTKNVSLIGEWFGFSPNNFDIAVGGTKVVSYTVTPSIPSTNSTNITYSKIVYLTGNFDNQQQEFKIFIPYADVGGLTNTSNYDSLMGVISQWCLVHPNETFCRTVPQYVYIYGNKSGEVSINFTQEMAKGIFDMMFKTYDDLALFQMYDKDWKGNMSANLNNQIDKLVFLEDYINEVENDRQSTTNFLIYILLIGIFIAGGGLIFVLIFTYKKINKLKALKRW